FYFTMIFNCSLLTTRFAPPLHDALPICADDDRIVAEERLLQHGGRFADLGLGGAAEEAVKVRHEQDAVGGFGETGADRLQIVVEDRKSTRLNSSHVKRSYAVFCLKKKK